MNAAQSKHNGFVLKWSRFWPIWCNVYVVEAIFIGLYIKTEIRVGKDLSSREKYDHRQIHGKTFIDGASETKTEELLQHNRNHLRIVEGPLTGHWKNI